MYVKDLRYERVNPITRFVFFGKMYSLIKGVLHILFVKMKHNFDI